MINIGFICLVGAIKPVKSSTTIFARLQNKLVIGVEQKIILLILGAIIKYIFMLVGLPEK